MTTAAPAPPATPAAGGVGPNVRVTTAGIIRSEWLRLRSLRSTWITLLVTALALIGLGALVTWAAESHWPPRDPSDALTFDPTAVSLVGTFLGQLSIGVLGVLAVTGEYSTGMIRSTFTAVPRRLSVLLCRAGVFATTALAVLVPTAFIAFLLGQQILSAKGIDTSLTAPGVARAVLGSALYLTGIGLLGMALGWLLRHTAGALATLYGVLLVLPIIVQFLPSPWPDNVRKWLPGGIGGGGNAIWQVHRDSDQLGPWTGYAVLIGYAVVLFALAAALLRKRDV